MDVSSLARPPQPQRPLVPTTVLPPKVEHVRKGMEVDRTSIRTRAAIIGGRLKQPMPEIEPILHIEMLGNPLTTPVVLVNRCRVVNTYTM